MIKSKLISVPGIKIIKNCSTVKIEFNLAQNVTHEIQKVGVFTGFFDPFHVMHAILGMELINRQIVDRVLYLPNTSTRKPHAAPIDIRMQNVLSDIALFFPYFFIGAQKIDNSNRECMDLLRKEFDDGEDLIWIASDSGKSANRIVRKMEDFSVDHSIDQVVSPFCSLYVLFYTKENEIIRALYKVDSDRIMLLKLPKKYQPIWNLHSTDLRQGKASQKFEKDYSRVIATVYMPNID